MSKTMFYISEKMNAIREILYVIGHTLLLYPAVFKFGNLFFVDLRFQQVIPSETTGWTVAAAAAGAYQQCRSFNMLAMSWFDW